MLLSDILEDAFLGDQKEATVVDRHNGTMEAVVQAPSARFHIADHALLAVTLEPRVLFKHGEPIAARQRDAGRHPSQER